MIDKPIPAKIQLTLADNKSNGEEFIGLSGTLYRQNLIFSEPRELRRNKNILELTVIFRDNNSFKNWHKNAEIEDFWHIKFEKILANKPETIKEKNVIIEIDNVTNCTCENPDFYILQGRSLQFADELTCNKCLGQVPYSKVPLEIALEDWQTKHERIYLNWLESGLFEKEAFKEMINYKNGKLNLEGEKIRKQLSDHFKIPVYISYFIEEPDEDNSCPICGQKGFDSGLERPNRICEDCNTIFGYEDK